MARIIAHRGSSLKYPENSLRAFQYAVKQGVDSLEVDVRRSADGILYCFHDHKLSRLTGKPGYFRRTESERIDRMRLNSSESILRLEQFLEEFAGRIQIVLDIKSAGIESDLFRLTDKRGKSTDIIFSSFNPKVVARVKEISPRLRTALIVSPIRSMKMKLDFSGFLIRNLKKLGCEAVHLSHRLAKPRLIERLDDKGILAAVWTVDNPEDAIKLLDMGVDGIISNVPELMVTTLSQTG